MLIVHLVQLMVFAQTPSPPEIPGEFSASLIREEMDRHGEISCILAELLVTLDHADTKLAVLIAVCSLHVVRTYSAVAVVGRGAVNKII
jgi:hypothetical protein